MAAGTEIASTRSRGKAAGGHAMEEGENINKLQRKKGGKREERGGEVGAKRMRE